MNAETFPPSDGAGRAGSNGRGSEDELTSLGEPAQFRMGTVSALAAAIGPIAGVIAFLLYRLIGFFTNLFFFHRIASDFTSARAKSNNRWGIWLLPEPRGLLRRLSQAPMKLSTSPIVFTRPCPAWMEESCLLSDNNNARSWCDTTVNYDSLYRISLGFPQDSSTPQGTANG